MGGKFAVLNISPYLIEASLEPRPPDCRQAPLSDISLKQTANKSFLTLTNSQPSPQSVFVGEVLLNRLLLATWVLKLPVKGI